MVNDNLNTQVVMPCGRRQWPIQMGREHDSKGTPSILGQSHTLSMQRRDALHQWLTQFNTATYLSIQGRILQSSGTLISRRQVLRHRETHINTVPHISIKWHSHLSGENVSIRGHAIHFKGTSSYTGCPEKTLTREILNKILALSHINVIFTHHHPKARSNIW